MITLAETPHCYGAPPLPHTIIRQCRVGHVTVVLGKFDGGSYFVCAVRDDGKIDSSAHISRATGSFGQDMPEPLDNFQGYIDGYRERLREAGR